MRLLRLHGRHLAAALRPAALRIILRPAAFILRVAAILYFLVIQSCSVLLSSCKPALYPCVSALQSYKPTLHPCFGVMQTFNERFQSQNYEKIAYVVSSVCDFMII